MMLKMYRAVTCSNEIREVDVIRQTEKFVVLEYVDWRGRKREKKELKSTGYYSYFETFQEAKDWLIERHTKKHAAAKSALDYARSKLEEAKRVKYEPSKNQ